MIPGRVREMYALYEAGATLQEVGEQYDITRERVRQLFGEHGLHVRSIAEAAALRRESELGRASDVVREFERSGDEREVAKKLGLSATSVHAIVNANIENPRLHRKRRTPKKRYSDQELIDCLREASVALGGVLTTGAYSEFARTRRFKDGRPWPTHQTHFHRFGSWRKALSNAGLRSNRASAIAGQHVFEREHCIDSVRDLARTLARAPTAAEYEQYARASNGAAPSLATVRNRCGRWYEVLRMAGL